MEEVCFVTIPPKDITEISVVEAPISMTIKFPHGASTSIPLPIAASMGFGTKVTSLTLEADSHARSSNARFSNIRNIHLGNSDHKTGFPDPFEIMVQYRS